MNDTLGNDLYCIKKSRTLAVVFSDPQNSANLGNSQASKTKTKQLTNV